MNPARDPDARIGEDTGLWNSSKHVLVLGTLIEILGERLLSDPGEEFLDGQSQTGMS